MVIFQPKLIILAIGFILLILGVLILFFVHRSKRDALIPIGKIVYNDLHGERSSLYSNKYPLVGKPDLIIRKGRRYIPVEIKTGHHNHPKQHHIMQLIAYCQLTKEHFKTSVPYGYLIYPDTHRRYKIRFNRSDELRLKSSLQKMNDAINQNRIVQNHKSKYKCNHCNMKLFCDKKIV